MNARAVFVFVTLLASACHAPPTEQGPRAQDAVSAGTFNIDPHGITVSGISAGGYMATMLHVAYSDVFSGAAVIAAGPYDCARGSLKHALGPCLGGDGLDVEALVKLTRDRARDGSIADPNAMTDHPLWVFHGTLDKIVRRPVGDALVEYQKAFTKADAIAYVNNVAAVHGFPTMNNGSSCDAQAADFINACGYDAAGALLTHLYRPLVAPDGAPGKLYDFPQEAFTAIDRNLDDAGLLFVPTPCAHGAKCRLHVALHGCRQGAEFIDQRFATETGYNSWAAANDIVVLYPQLRASAIEPMNPNGCWDWWGYTGDAYATRDGKQLVAIRAMVSHLTGTELPR